MIWEVAKKEIFANITSPKVVITYIVCSVLIITAMITGAYNYLTIRDEVVRQTAAERDRLSNIFDFNQDYLQRGIFLFREPSMLSVLVSGVEGDAARRATLSQYSSPNYDVSRFNSTPILALFGFIDLEFIVKMILSLFAILFTYDAISGEKELGTLKLNLANGVKRSSFIIGKLIGSFLLLIIPFLIPFLLGLLVLQFINGISFSGEDWIRISMLVFVFILFISSFYSMGIMVSSLTKRSSTSFLVLLMLWVLFIAVVPRVSVLISQSVHPVPSVDEIRKEIIVQIGPAIREFRTDLQKKAQVLRGEIERRRPRPPIVQSSQAKAAYEQKQKEFQAYVREQQTAFQKEVMEGYKEITQNFRNDSSKVIEEQEKKQDIQDGLAITLSRFASPAGALTFATDRLAKSGVNSSDEIFKKNVRQTVEAFADANNKYIAEHPQVLSGLGATQTEPIDISDFYPDIQKFQAEPLNTSISAVITDFAILAVISIVFMAVAFVSFMRYDVR